MSLSVWSMAYEGDEEGVRAHLAAHPGAVDNRDEEGRTLLHLAARGGRVGVVRLLLDRGADPNAARANGHTPVSAAALHAWESGALESARLLVSAGGRARLQEAIKIGDDARVDTLLGETPDWEARWGGETPMEAAGEAGRVAMGRRMVEAGAPLDVWSAASFGYSDALASLLDGDPSLLEAERRSGHYRPLHCAAECGQPEAATTLIDRGAEIDARQMWGFRPLHLAALAAREMAPHDGHVAIAELLLARGAAASPEDDYGRRPLQFAEDQRARACAAGRIADMLLAHGA